MILIKIIIDLLNSLFVKKKKDIYKKKEVRLIKPLKKTKKFNITINESIRLKYKKGWVKKTRKKQIKEIVLHGTAGGNPNKPENIINWILQTYYVNTECVKISNKSLIY